MPPVSVLIKPVSSSCELSCSYCFYRDEAKNRERACHGRMSDETAQAVIRRVLGAADGAPVTFTFQGGEPLLAGLDFYRAFTDQVERMNTRNTAVNYSLQTNGLALDEAFASFFAERNFLIGLSLDGPADIHDRCRRDIDGKGSYSRVMKTASLLRRAGAEFNILTVLTDASARKIASIYAFMKKNGFRWMQFIPCIAPLSERSRDTLSAEGWLFAHRRLFDLWFSDLCEMAQTRVPPPSIRYFDDLVRLFAGFPSEQCGSRGVCSIQYVIEADGSVYPCDFFALDEYRMGSIHEQTLAGLAASDAAVRFLERRGSVDKQMDKCASCRYRKLCGGGCLRYYESGEYKYCDATREFLDSAAERLAYAARLASR